MKSLVCSPCVCQYLVYVVQSWGAEVEGRRLHLAAWLLFIGCDHWRPYIHLIHMPNLWQRPKFWSAMSMSSRLAYIIVYVYNISLLYGQSVSPSEAQVELFTRNGKLLPTFGSTSRQPSFSSRPLLYSYSPLLYIWYVLKETPRFNPRRELLAMSVVRGGAGDSIPCPQLCDGTRV